MPGTAFLIRKDGDGKPVSGGNPNLLQGLLGLHGFSSEEETAKAVADLMTRKFALRAAPSSVMRGGTPTETGYLVLRQRGKPLTLGGLVGNLDTSAGVADGKAPPVPTLPKCLEAMRPVHEALEEIRKNPSLVDGSIDHAAHHAAMTGGESLGSMILKALAEKKVSLIGDKWVSTVQAYLMAFVNAQRLAAVIKSTDVANAFDLKMQSLTKP
jgi:hypothetical protein